MKVDGKNSPEPTLPYGRRITGVFYRKSVPGHPGALFVLPYWHIAKITILEYL